MKRVWDNSNIIESYPGIVSPLTFSYAKFAYKKVYSQTAIIFGINQKYITENDRYLNSMLGYVNGHMYYNIKSWLVLVSYLPGFSANQKNLQEMMGVKEKNIVAVEKPHVSFWSKIKTIFSFLKYYSLIEYKTEEWIKYFDKEFHRYMKKIEAVNSADEALEVFYSAEKTLLDYWYIPILNDFSVMINSTLLKNYLKKNPNKNYELKDLSIGMVGNSELIVELRKIVKIIRKKIDINKVSLEYVQDVIKGDKEIQTSVNRYIFKYGLRNGQNLKLEDPGLDEGDGSALAQLIMTYLEEYSEKKEIHNKNKDVQRSFIEKILVKHYINAVKRREVLRVKRSQSFSLVRKVFITIAEDFVQQGVLKNIDDIFYLEKDEIFGLLEGNYTLKNVQSLIDERKREHKVYKSLQVSNHFVTASIPSHSKESINIQESIKEIEEGRVNYQGKITAEVVLMEKLNFDTDVKGKILVCKYTDPNWVPLFGVIKGLIVERGGVLSHAAIVSRELKIPSVIGVENAFNVLKNGQKITLDATEGRIIH